MASTQNRTPRFWQASPSAARSVRKPLANWNPFWANIQVYSYLWFDAAHTKRWRDKIGIWFRRTGWRPADVEASYPKRNTDLAEFEKFDPPIAARNWPSA